MRLPLRTRRQDKQIEFTVGTKDGPYAMPYKSFVLRVLLRKGEELRLVTFQGEPVERVASSQALAGATKAWRVDPEDTAKGLSRVEVKIPAGESLNVTLHVR